MSNSLEKDLKHDPPCHPRACAIQSCLDRSHFQEEKCQKQIDALYQCCDAFYKQNGEDAKTVSCPKLSLLRLKMKQRSESK